MPNIDPGLSGAERRDAMIALIRSSWDRWVSVLHSLTPEQLNQANICGSWSAKDLIGHVAVWDGVAAGKVRGILAGAEREDTGETLDAFNERTAREFQTVRLDDLVERMHRTHERFLGTLGSAEGASDEMIQGVEHAVADDTWKHYDQHRRQLVDRFRVNDVA
jgi:hypothetical protein